MPPIQCSPANHLLLLQEVKDIVFLRQCPKIYFLEVEHCTGHIKVRGLLFIYVCSKIPTCLAREQGHILSYLAHAYFGEHGFQHTLSIPLFASLAARAGGKAFFFPGAGSDKLWLACGYKMSSFQPVAI